MIDCTAAALATYFATDPTAQVIHDCFDPNGKLVPFAPRSVLRRVCELYEAEEIGRAHV